METRYRELLDSKGRALIDRIESYGSAEIGIEQPQITLEIGVQGSGGKMLRGNIRAE